VTQPAMHDPLGEAGPMIRAGLGDLVERARRLAVPGQRRMIGITGAPGAGKTTVASELVTQLGQELAVLVPMDGFHLANSTLIGWGRRERKGAWDTFDAGGYVHLLRRLKDGTEDVVHAPDFDRDVDESIGSAVPVAREVPLVVTEGNYLLSRLGAWAQVAPLLDESWYLDVDDETRQERLVRRHERHGMAHDQAVSWTLGTDQTNAALVAESRARADLVVMITPGRTS
jgi:pantothenate kinase